MGRTGLNTREAQIKQRQVQMPNSDPDENARQQREWYERNREKKIAQKNERKEGVRVWLQGYKATLVCQTCGEDHPATFDFHHRDPLTKNYTISSMPGRGHRPERILEEIVKCDILCSNCHRKLHASMV